MALIHNNHSFFLKLFLFLIIFLTFNTCSEDKPTSPDDNNNDNTAIASATIGPGGGELKTEDFSLVVPSGSFPNEVTLSLSVSDEDSPFGENSVSSIYGIRGIPNEFNNSIRIAVKYTGSLSDSSYIVISSKSTNYFTEDSVDAYRFISAIDSSGFLVGYLMNYPSGNTVKSFNMHKSTENYIIYTNPVTGFTDMSTEKFIFKAGFGWSSETLLRIGNLFEETHSKISNELEFSYLNNPKGSGACFTNYWKWKFPLEVIIADVNDNIILDYEHDWFDTKGPQIVIDKSLLDASNESLATGLIGKTLLTLAIKTYNNYCVDRVWLEHATIDWFRGYFDNTYKAEYPSVLEGNVLAPFHGIQNGAEVLGDHKKHGNGMGSVFKYLEKYVGFNENNLSKAFKNIHEDGFHPSRALLANVDALISDWWPGFFEKFVTGELTNSLSSVFTNYGFLSGSLDINSNSDVEVTFTEEYSDISAKSFEINLNSSELNETSTLFLDAYKSGAANNDGVATLVFGLNSNYDLYNIIAERNRPAEIPNLKSYYDDNIRKFLVVVVNSITEEFDYSGVTEIDLVAKINNETENELLKSNRCAVKIKVMGHMKKVEGGIIEKYDEQFQKGLFVATGSFTGNTFNGDWNITDLDPLFYNGTVKVTLNNDHDMVTEVIWTENYISYVDGSPSFESTSSFTGNNINLFSTFIPGDFQISGIQTCATSHLSSLTYSAHSFVTSANISLENHSCNEYSYITISFGKE